MAYHYSWYCVPSSAAAIIILVPLYLAFCKRHLGPRASVLSFLLILNLYTMACETFLIAAETPNLTLFWDKMICAGICFIPAALFHINIVVFNSKIFRPLLYIPGLIFLGLLPTDLFISGVEPTFYGWGKIVGPVYSSFGLHMILYAIVYTIFIVSALAKEKSKRILNEFLWLALATVPTILIGSAVVIILPLFHITSANIMAHAICVIWNAVVTAFAILSKRLLDVYVKIPIIGRSKKKLNRKVTQALMEISTRAHTYEEILAKMESLFFVEINACINGKIIDSGKNNGSTPNKLLKDNFLSDNNQMLIRPELPQDSDAYKIMDQHQIDIIAPLYSYDKRAGLVCLGAGITDFLYSPRDLRLLELLLSHLSFAVEFCDHIKANRHAQVILRKSRNLICHIQTSGPVQVVVVDDDNKTIHQDGRVYPMLFKNRQPDVQNSADDAAGELAILAAKASTCPECNSSAVYTAIAMLYSLDHCTGEVQVAQMFDLSESTWHGCNNCGHQWVSGDSKPPPAPGPSNVVALDKFRR